MRWIILLLLVLSTLIIGCATQEEIEQEAAEVAIAEEETLEEVDDSLIDENEEVDIGDMI